MKVISTETAPAAIGPYSQAIVTNGLVFASGQIPVDPATGAPAGDTIDTQAEQSCKNVAAILAAAGSDMTKVVKTTCFLADMADFAKFNEIYAKYFGQLPGPLLRCRQGAAEGCSLRNRSYRGALTAPQK